jgi:hypothetical protein
MAEAVIVPVAVLVGVLLWLTGAVLYAPSAANRVVEWWGRLREASRGPQPTGLPIEQLAADLRRLLYEHERLTRSRSEWQRVHHLRACELALHDRAEEAAVALGLPACRLAEPGWTTADLERRLWQLRVAGMVLPADAGLSGVA